LTSRAVTRTPSFEVAGTIGMMSAAVRRSTSTRR
jgi:hypothetical protein